MSRVRVGKDYAVFSPDFSEPVIQRLIRTVANRSRRIRAWVFGWAPSRLRSAVIARYLWGAMQGIAGGDMDDYLRAVRPSAELHLFDIATYRGPAGWAAVLDDWVTSFGTSYVVEEYLHPKPGRVAMVAQFNGVATGSGVELGQRFGFVLDFDEDGMATGARFYRTKKEALDAVGLSE